MNDDVVMILYSRFGMLAERMFVLMGYHKADMFLLFHYSPMIHKMLDWHQSGHLGSWKAYSTEKYGVILLKYNKRIN